MVLWVSTPISILLIFSRFVWQQIYIIMYYKKQSFSLLRLVNDLSAIIETGSSILFLDEDIDNKTISKSHQKN